MEMQYKCHVLLLLLKCPRAAHLPEKARFSARVFLLGEEKRQNQRQCIRCSACSGMLSCSGIIFDINETWKCIRSVVAATVLEPQKKQD